MSKVKEKKSVKVASLKELTKESATLGRKRDLTLDVKIIEAAINVLAEVGFDKMTMDMVAAGAKSGKATLYRRWSSKAELVKDTLIWMSKTSVELETLPDTGNIRSDLLTLLKPYSIEHSERKLRVLSGLGSFFSEHQKLAEEATAGIFEPWTAINRKLLQRAIEKGEIPPQADIETVCQVIVSTVFYRTVGQHKSFDEDSYSVLLDNIILLALKNPHESN